MKQYITDNEAIFYSADSNFHKIIEVIANAYIGRNPALPFTFRCYSMNGISQLSDGRYDIDLSKKFPESTNGQYAYAFGMVWVDDEAKIEASLNCYGPITIYVNGDFFFKSGVVEEVNAKVQKILIINLKKGWNGIFIIMRKVASGFGCKFGSNRGGLHFISPFLERKGWGGWIFSEPSEKDVLRDKIPGISAKELETGIEWYPSLKWNEKDCVKNSFSRLFGQKQGGYAYAWTKIQISAVEYKSYRLSGSSRGFATIWIDGNKVLSSIEGGRFSIDINLSHGGHDLLVLSSSIQDDWGVDFDELQLDTDYYFSKPYPIMGTNDPWFYLGLFEKPLNYLPQEIQNIHRLFETNKNEKLYWRVDTPATWIRPYIENLTSFAKWNYPLGVTLYGLLMAGKFLDRQDIICYVLQHFSACIQMYAYSLWDKERYGYPSINQKLVGISMLDDCGSMGATLLEAYNEVHDNGYLYIADLIADYIVNKQERRKDGAFYRNSKGYFMENTMWADDLYMSTPFLMRYFKLSNNRKYIDEAAKQFILFKKYLYMENLNLMSHIYDFKYQTPTNIPWGRGNGWPLFSLSQLLWFLPEDHAMRPELLKFFNNFSNGVLSLQGKNGIWHQILTDTESYEETSSTAMFIYAFSRGIRFNWLKDKSTYIKAVQKAWEGLTKSTIDKNGNIHGVCRGSRYSFLSEYYKEDLLPLTNDTHGIGIVLLAGIELDLMLESLAKSNSSNSNAEVGNDEYC